MGKRALVLSGGGMFGAWQAGAWSVLAPHFRPDLVVGASVGSLNGYAIAAGCTPQELLGLWRRPDAAGFRQLPATIRSLMDLRPLEIQYAVVLVDALRMKEETFVDGQVTWRHLLASCAVPGMAPPQRIGAKWYIDGGLLNPLPIHSAVALGATEILALNALTSFPVPALVPFVRGFQAVFRKKVAAAPGHVAVTTLVPPVLLGSLSDARYWKAEHIERWYANGVEDATDAIRRGLVRAAHDSQNISATDCLKP